MNEIANAEAQSEMSIIDGLAMQARALRLSINVNMWQLARVFVEAKALVSHGEWGTWLQENADVSVRTAEDMIASYKRFGGRAPFEQLSRAQVFKLLPLPEGTEEKFMQEHDVKSMSSREIQEAVKQVRAEVQAEANVQIEAAENRAQNMISYMKNEIAQKDQEIERLTEIGRDSMEESRRLTRENAELRHENQETQEMLSEQQEMLNRAQEDLLNLQSAQARGDAESRVSDEMSIDVFSQAVRSFMGACARFPYMRSAFSVMDEKTKAAYREYLDTMQGFIDKSRAALDCYAAEGGIVVG